MIFVLCQNVPKHLRFIIHITFSPISRATAPTGLLVRNMQTLNKLILWKTTLFQLCKHSANWRGDIELILRFLTMWLDRLGWRHVVFFIYFVMDSEKEQRTSTLLHNSYWQNWSCCMSKKQKCKKKTSNFLPFLIHFSSSCRIVTIFHETEFSLLYHW